MLCFVIMCIALRPLKMQRTKIRTQFKRYLKKFQILRHLSWQVLTAKKTHAWSPLKKAKTIKLVRSWSAHQKKDIDYRALNHEEGEFMMKEFYRPILSQLQLMNKPLQLKNFKITMWNW
jgi:hypothetical protein